MDNIIEQLSKKSGNELLQLVQQLSASLTKDEMARLAGYFSGVAETNRQLAQAFSQLAGIPVSTSAGAPSVAGAAAGGSEVTVLFASHSGNGKGFANKVQAQAEKAGFKVKVCNMAKFKPKDLKNEKNVLFIVSTHGEGVPPAAAEDLFEFLSGPRAHKLEGLKFSVLALGDKSYVHFCKAGVDLDAMLVKLGAERIFERVDCDVDFAENAQRWLSGSLAVLAPQAGGTVVGAPSAAASASESILGKTYSQKEPYSATVLSKVNLHGRGSDKETYHIELSVEGAGIKYQPGDSCGVLSQNSDKLVNELLAKIKLDGSAAAGKGAEAQPLAQVLKGYELTVLTKDVIQNHNKFADSQALRDLLGDASKLKDYIYGRDIVDLLNEFPVRYNADDLLSVLRLMPPRLYSIASSPLANDGEVHILVGAVRYNALERDKEGVASTFWADRIKENEQAPIYIKPNDMFRLPEDGNAPIIMIGPGTGVAPFRSFVGERAARGDKGKSWLFFGHQHFQTDFLYQTDWQEYLADGVLTRMDVAFSRDQQEKLYVQHKIRKHAEDIYQWIQEGAFIYICGDSKRMAPDVQQAFVDIVQEEGALTKEQALEQIKDLKLQGRYLEDVY